VVRTGLPQKVILSTPGVTFWPSVAAWLLTQTSPATMAASAARREQTPASARNFWRRMGSADIGGNMGAKRGVKQAPARAQVRTRKFGDFLRGNDA
jgi:hypothetical protein